MCLRKMYIVSWDRQGGVHGLSYTHCLLFIKTKKLQEHDLSQNQILQLHLTFFFPGRITEKFKNGVTGAPAQMLLGSEYSCFY